MKDLEHLRVLTISGEDAGELLQGQMTQDIRKLEDEKIHITSFCNVQGRVIASAFIQGRNDQYDLILSSEIIDDLENHLKRYVLRSKVVIEQSIEKTFGSYKSDVNEDSKEYGSLKNDPERVLILSTQAPKSIDNFITSEEWIRCDIENKIAIIDKESSEKFIPQMLNLDILDAVSFSKGCYTGQEVVARVQHRGKVKKRMYKINIKETDSVDPHTQIMAQKKSVGNIVLSKKIANDCICLAVINQVDSTSELTVNEKSIELL
tara:strand:+ start:286 stop:1074 length:789 start_codon:yes stop_codon:yes gene_type:complete